LNNIRSNYHTWEYLVVSSIEGEEKAAVTTASSLNSSFGQAGRDSGSDLNALTLTSGARAEDELKN
jgi:hypothetical protein